MKQNSQSQQNKWIWRLCVWYVGRDFSDYIYGTGWKQCSCYLVVSNFFLNPVIAVCAQRFVDSLERPTRAQWFHRMRRLSELIPWHRKLTLWNRQWNPLEGCKGYASWNWGMSVRRWSGLPVRACRVWCRCFMW